MSIDPNFRPTCYSDFDNPVALALNGINGQMRRTMVRDMMTAEGEQREEYDALLGPIEPNILEERAKDPAGASALMGPSWLGGEYLPPRSTTEVEIARVILRSVTMDVFSLRARWSGGRYHYRVVDEYGSTFTLCRKTSRRPLTLAQVIEVLQTASVAEWTTDAPGVVEPWWDQQARHQWDAEDCTDFAWVESDLYPDLETWYEERAEEWRQEEHPWRSATEQGW